MKRIISVVIAIVMFLSSSISIYASGNEQKQVSSVYGQNMLDYLMTDNHKLLIKRENYGYMQFADNLRKNAGSLYRFKMVDMLIDTGTEPDKQKYMEVLINIIGTYELDNAGEISEQKNKDNLKGLEDYAMDIVDMSTNAVSVMVGNNPAASKYEEEILTAIDRISIFKDNTNNWLKALSDLETVVENYEKYDQFLELVEKKSEGNLKEAASTLRNGMSKIFLIKLDTYGEISDENFENYGKLFFYDIFWKVVKQTKEYETDTTLKEFVDCGEDFVSKAGILKSSWELGLGIGKLVGNVAVGGEDLINRALEIFAIYDISSVLQLEVGELAVEFFEEVGTEKESEICNQYVTLAQYLIGCRIRGEYCIYSIVANDAGLLSWFNKKSAEEAKLWYDDKVDKITSIQSLLAEVTMGEESDNLDISEYLEQYEQIVSILDMQVTTDYWQFENWKSYVVDQFYLEEGNGAFSMKNEGASYVKLYGISLGDNVQQVEKTMKENEWIPYYNTESMYEYVALINNREYILSFNVDDKGNVTSWYLNNWPEGEDIAEIFSGLQGKLDSDYAFENPVKENSEPVSLKGNWCSVDGKYIFHFGNYGDSGDFADAYYVSFESDENISCNVKDDGGNQIFVTPFNDNRKSYTFLFVNEQLVTDDFVLNRVPDKYTTRLIGSWGNSDYMYEFDEHGKYYLSGKESSWGMYYVVSDSQIVISNKSEDFRVIDCIVDGNKLILNNDLVFQREGEYNNSIEEIESLVDVICGTWLEENMSMEEYRFYSNGLYERYSVVYHNDELSYSDCIESGNYMVIDSNTVRVSFNGGFTMDFTYNETAISLQNGYGGEIFIKKS